jgi:hypothetical protein
MLNEAHASDAQRDMRLRDLLAHARHEGCGRRAAKAEVLTGIEGASSRPVRRTFRRWGCKWVSRFLSAPQDDDG